MPCINQPQWDAAILCPLMWMVPVRATKLTNTSRRQKAQLSHTATSLGVTALVTRFAACLDADDLSWAETQTKDVPTKT